MFNSSKVQSKQKGQCVYVPVYEICKYEQYKKKKKRKKSENTKLHNNTQPNEMKYI